MKIIQSLWSKPGFKKDKLNDSDRNKGGWTDKKYNYFSWALSCLQFRKYYDEVELVTDKPGYDLLVNKLELPYTSVKTVLDDLNQYHTDLWALGKIYAYRMQDKPFIHADGDVYIWEKFDEKLEAASLLAQNIEEGFFCYKGIFKNITDNFEFVPDSLLASIDKHEGIVAVSAGIIGGKNTWFFKKFANRVFEFVDKNYAHLHKIDIGMFNLVFEQFFLKAQAEAEGLEFNYFASNVNQSFDGLADLTGVPARVKYIHPVGIHKKMNLTGNLVAYQLQKEHPVYYYKIMNLLRTCQV